MNNGNMIKKVGIVTYHRPINYGAILQAFALQKKIKEFGVECEIIDYRNSILEDLHRKKKLTEAKNIKHFFRDMLLKKHYNLKYDKFRKFAEQNLNLSKPFHDYKELPEIEKLYDKFVVGSDQVWNYKINKMDPAFFLGFVKSKDKKTSYAASFGVSNISDLYRDSYIKYLSDFDEILVREKQGTQIISNLLSKESRVVLDPTLLHSKEEWYNISKEQKVTNNRYILVYAFGGSKYIMDLAKNISKETGYKIVCISNTYKHSFIIKYVKSAGPDEFLGLIKGAEYVITNSFHGTAFSINFNKQFLTELLDEGKGTNSRMQDLLDLFNLSERIIKDSNPRVIDNKIDYDVINKILDEKRCESLALLSKTVLGKNVG